MSRKNRERYAAIRQSFWRHPDTVGISLAAKGLFACGLSYAADCLTDGFIPLAVASTLLAQGDQKAVQELIFSEQWEEVEGGYMVAKYLDHNKSKKQLDALNTARKKAGKAGGKSKANRVASATAKPKQNASKTLGDIDIDIELPPSPLNGAEEGKKPIEILSDEIRELEQRADATPEAAWRLIDKLSQRFPWVDPGTPTATRKKALASCLVIAESIAAKHEVTPMKVLSAEWDAMLRLAEEDDFKPDNPVAYFFSGFPKFRRKQVENVGMPI